MTYIEFFDRTAPRNIGSCLTCVPDRVILVGDETKRMKKHIECYQRIFADRGHEIEFLCKAASKNNLEHSVSVLTEMVETYDDCVFDVTGGGELLLLALGIVYARFPEKNIQIHRCNFNNNTLVDCDQDGNTVYREPPKLTVAENIRIYGGDVVYGDVDQENTYCWDLSPEFLSDLDLIWSVCRNNVRYWNMQISILEAVESVGVCSEDGLTTEAAHSAVEHWLSQRRAKYKVAKGILSALKKAGLITWFADDEETITISYKNPQIKKCLTRAGMALEMKIFTVAKRVVDKEGVPVYDDALNGVMIDWDGKLHDEETEHEYDTENEVDVVLMHNIIPVFISCKNGIVTADELYKLNTVAERFGGKYAKKVLITTSLSSLGPGAEYFRQRAKDMDIRLLEEVQNLSDTELERKIKSFWCN